jgi:hypothetical protein
VQEVESLPEDQTVDFHLWKGDAAGIDESMLKSQTALQAYDVDVKDYPSLKKAETETQVCSEVCFRSRNSLPSFKTGKRGRLSFSLD